MIYLREVIDSENVTWLFVVYFILSLIKIQVLVIIFQIVIKSYQNNGIRRTLLDKVIKRFIDMENETTIVTTDYPFVLWI